MKVSFGSEVSGWAHLSVHMPFLHRAFATAHLTFFLGHLLAWNLPHHLSLAVIKVAFIARICVLAMATSQSPVHLVLTFKVVQSASVLQAKRLFWAALTYAFELTKSRLQTCALYFLFSFLQLAKVPVKAASSPITITIRKNTFFRMTLSFTSGLGIQ